MGSRTWFVLAKETWPEAYRTGAVAEASTERAAVHIAEQLAERFAESEPGHHYLRFEACFPESARQRRHFQTDLRLLAIPPLNSEEDPVGWLRRFAHVAGVSVVSSTHRGASKKRRPRHTRKTAGENGQQNPDPPEKTDTRRSTERRLSATEQSIWDALEDKCLLGKELCKMLTPPISENCVRGKIRTIKFKSANGPTIENRPGLGYYRTDAEPDWDEVPPKTRRQVRTRPSCSGSSTRLTLTLPHRASPTTGDLSVSVVQNHLQQARWLPLPRRSRPLMDPARQSGAKRQTPIRWNAPRPPNRFPTGPCEFFPRRRSLFSADSTRPTSRPNQNSDPDSAACRRIDPGVKILRGLATSRFS